MVIRNAAPLDMVATARDRILAGMPASERRILAPAELATHPDVIRLFRDTCLADIMHKEMGPYPDVVSCQIATTPGHDKLGGKPYPHVDGSWGGAIPTRAEEIDLEKGRPRNEAHYFGDNDDRLGTNDGQLWQDPDRTVSLGSYTAVLGVALNDQLPPGNGQFGVLRGLHEEVEAAFRNQRDAGSVIGPEGLDWPRIKIGENGRPFLNGLPETVRTKAEKAGRDVKPIDGWPWPEVTPVLLGEGDAVIALHSGGRARGDIRGGDWLEPGPVADRARPGTGGPGTSGLRLSSSRGEGSRSGGRLLVELRDGDRRRTGRR